MARPTFWVMCTCIRTCEKGSKGPIEPWILGAIAGGRGGFRFTVGLYLLVAVERHRPEHRCGVHVPQRCLQSKVAIVVAVETQHGAGKGFVRDESPVLAT
jgi:hypothetical protein